MSYWKVSVHSDPQNRAKKVDGNFLLIDGNFLLDVPCSNFSTGKRKARVSRCLQGFINSAPQADSRRYAFMKRFAKRS